MTQIRRVCIDQVDPPTARPQVDHLFVRFDAGGVDGRFGPVPGRVAALALRLALHLDLVGADATGHRERQRRFSAALSSARGIARWALGALDCAMWDLRGWIVGVPVARLLAAVRPAATVPVYASWLELDLDAPTALAAMAQVASEGFPLTKWALRRPAAPIPDTQAADMLAVAARRAVAATGAPVAFDALGTWTAGFIKQVADRLVEIPPVRPAWVEDPLSTLDPTAYQALDLQAALPLGVGERLPDRQTIARVLRVARPAVLTPDVAWLGGLTAARSVLPLALDADVPVWLHGRAFTPALQLAAAYPDIVAGVEYQRAWEPHRQALYTRPLTPINGRVLLPDVPGLGIHPHPARPYVNHY